MIQNFFSSASFIRPCIALWLTLTASWGHAQIESTSFVLPSNEWTQIVVPGTLPPGSNTVGAIFGQALSTDDYPARWALFAYQSETATYDPVALSTPINTAQAYWIIQITGLPVTLTVPLGTLEPVGSQNSSGNYVIAAEVADESPLSSNVGWAMIGKPGSMQTQVNGLQITTSAAGPCNVGTPCTVGEAFTQGLVSDTLFGYNATSGTYDTYQATDFLPDWRGFWFASVTMPADVSGLSVHFPALAPTTADFNDEFDSASLQQWERRHLVENSMPQYTLLDVNLSAPGALSIIPTRTPGWFAGNDAPLIFKLVTGNFSVESFVSAQSTSNPGEAPNFNFNSAGLMARNPAGAAGSENHVMVNVGQQNGAVGSETKTTVNSISELDIIEGSNVGRLILCRIGSRFHAYRWLDNESNWTLIRSLNRPDLPATVQVGMVANAFSGVDLTATFDYIRLRIPQDQSQCTGE